MTNTTEDQAATERADNIAFNVVPGAVQLLITRDGVELEPVNIPAGMTPQFGATVIVNGVIANQMAEQQAAAQLAQQRAAAQQLLGLDGRPLPGVVNGG